MSKYIVFPPSEFDSISKFFEHDETLRKALTSLLIILERGGISVPRDISKSIAWLCLKPKRSTQNVLEFINDQLKTPDPRNEFVRATLGIQALLLHHSGKFKLMDSHFNSLQQAENAFVLSDIYYYTVSGSMIKNQDVVLGFSNDDFDDIIVNGNPYAKKADFRKTSILWGDASRCEFWTHDCFPLFTSLMQYCHVEGLYYTRDKCTIALCAYVGDIKDKYLKERVPCVYKNYTYSNGIIGSMKQS